MENLGKLGRIWKSIKNWFGWYLIGAFLYVVLFFIVLIAILAIPAAIIEQYCCYSFANLNNLPHQFDAFKGCFVQYGEHWIRPEQFIQLLGGK